MLRLIRNRSFFIAVTLVLSSLATFSQQDGMNTFSPYTIYGIGSMNMLGSAENKSMAGSGLASKNTVYMNALNPAGLSATPSQTFLFSFGVQGNNNYLKSSANKSSNNNFNISEIGFQFPIARKLGFGFLMNPYSSVGYKISQNVTDPDVVTNVGNVSYDYRGSGGTTLLKAGLGYEPFKGLSIGANLLYYHGSIERYAATNIDPIMSPTYEYRSIQSNSKYQFGKINAELGLIYSITLKNYKTLNFGLTYQPKMDISVDQSKDITSYGNVTSDSIYSASSKSQLVLPQKFAAGISYGSPKLILSLDYIHQNFQNAYEIASAESNVSLTRYQDIRMGLSYTPNRYDIRSAMKRWTYRAGIRYGNSYMTVNDNKINDYSLTVGLGVPLQQNGLTHMNIGFDVGRRGSIQNTLIQETYFRIYLGINLFVTQEWFVRHKFK